MYYDQLTTLQIEKLDKKIPVVLPIAATEQHGPHLPLATDRMIGDHLCQAIEAFMPEEVLILPMVSVGCSEHHTVFSGSLSLRHETMLNYIKDIAHWIHAHGFKNLIIFNSHGGNQAVAGVFQESFGFRHPDIHVVVMTWWKLIAAELPNISTGGPSATGHAGELETSLMLVIAPHLVHLDLIPEFANLPEPDWMVSSLMTGPSVSVYRHFKQKSPTGVFGRPKLATKEKGESITQAVVEQFSKILSDLKKW